MRRYGVGAALLLLLGVGLLLGGCSTSIGLTQELPIDEPLGSAAVTDIEIDMGAGTLSIGPGADGLVSGIIHFNVEPWKPEVKRSDTRLTIKQGSKRNVSAIGGSIVNDWDLQLGLAPMRLKVTAGAYDGAYELGGLILQELSISDGAAKSEVRFSSPNPGQMDRLKYETGASTVTLEGLANANFKTMEFTGGAGSYSLDFTGQLRTDATVRIEAGAATVRISVPVTTSARITVSGSLNDVALEGAWTTAGDTYTTPAVLAVEQGKALNITLEMNVGSVTLVTE